ncbi:hypothetical protein [Thalassoglobus polymorphus]|uniref:Uncharacterized protein n=1 Tax=Thalassoglobus polymorphus TaxID=2527994 RepID=A0A517QLE0_9PLAN|nr:hypothetical protein [Thalassoglobus polymorphus]QDT32443.1 hypothetical protein Mal48_16890 [Thalassoglobus polymorphus]
MTETQLFRPTTFLPFLLIKSDFGASFAPGRLLSFLFLTICAPHFAFAQQEAIHQLDLRIPNGAFPQPVPIQQFQRIRVRGNGQNLRMQQPFVVRGGALIRSQPQQFDQRLKENGLGIFENRIRAFLVAQANWIDICCDLSMDQKRDYEQLIEKELEELRENRAKYHFTLRDVLPVTLTTQGITNRFSDDSEWHKKIKNLLSENQREKLTKEQTLRNDRLLSALADHSYCELTKTLHFTPDQEASLKNHFKAYLKDSEHLFYSNKLDSVVFDYRSTYKLLDDFPEDLLSPPQRTKLKRTANSKFVVRRGNQPLQLSIIQINFSTADNEFSFDEAIQNSLEETKQRVRYHLQLHTDEIAAILKLTEAEVKQLELAQLGVAQYLVENQKKTVREDVQKTQDRLEKRGLGKASAIQIIFPHLSDSTILMHPIFTEVIKNLGPHYEEYQRILKEQSRLSQVSYLVSLLDRELWLSQTQSESLHDLLESRLAVQIEELSPEIYEIVLVAFALNSISDTEIEQALNAPQIQVWQELKRQFEFQDKTTAILNFPDKGSIIFKLPKQISN